MIKIKDIFAILFTILTVADLLMFPVSVIGAIWTYSAGGSDIFYFWLKMIPITAVAFLPLLIISKLLLERSY